MSFSEVWEQSGTHSAYVQIVVTPLYMYVVLVLSATVDFCTNGYQPYIHDIHMLKDLKKTCLIYMYVCTWYGYIERNCNGKEKNQESP